LLLVACVLLTNLEEAEVFSLRSIYLGL
jgi:hypothetical protein